MSPPRSFRIQVPDEVLEDIRARVAAYPWHEMPDDGGWDYGTNLDYMRELCAWWLERFDWRAQEARLNRFAHFKAPVGGIDIHYIHERGSGPAPLPLIISHGWPGSVVEFLDIIEPLAHPERFGAAPATLSTSSRLPCPGSASRGDRLARWARVRWPASSTA